MQPKLLKIEENGIKLVIAINENIRLYEFGTGALPSYEKLQKELEYIPPHNGILSPSERAPVDKRAFAFNQVHLAGGNRDIHHGCKNHYASESSVCKYVTHNFSKTEFGKLMKIVSKTDKVEMTTFFQFFDNICALKIWNNVKNISNSEICLEEVNSFFYNGLGEGGKKSPFEKLNFYLPTNSWHIEVQWKKQSLKEWMLFNGNDNLSMKRISITNNGSWSTKEYLPMGMLEDTESGEFMLWQIENNGSWHYEISDNQNKLYLNVGGPNFESNLWAKKLQPNECFEGVASAIAFGQSLDDVFANITKYRRQIRRKNNDNINIPTVFNSYMHGFWDNPLESQIKPLIDTVADLGIDYFCIDAGWHDEVYWWDAIGAWKESKLRFPNGLQNTVDYIKSKGMKVGLWLEIESIGMNSSAVNTYSDECFFFRNGQKILDHSRYFLDFSNDEVRKRATETVDYMMSFGIDYIKIDCNVDTGVGNETGSDSLGDGLLKHNRAYVEWLKSILEKYPDLVIENCGSGGCRMDYKMLAVHSIQSTSDQINYKKYPYIAANSITALCPEQSAVWSYPLADLTLPEDLSDEVIVFNMVNCLLGRMHLASFLNKLNEQQLKIVKEGVEYYNSMKNTKINSIPFMPLGFANFGGKLVASGLCDDKKLYLAVWNLDGDKNVKIPLGNKQIKSCKIGFPQSDSLNWKIEKQILHIEFTEDFQARMFEIDMNSGE